jgi:Phosphodiester glycosidase
MGPSPESISEVAVLRRQPVGNIALGRAPYGGRHDQSRRRPPCRGPDRAGHTDVRSEYGRLPLARGLDVVNGGPRSLRHGRPAITADAEGFDHPGDPAFYYAFALRRNPRTIAGVTRDGRLVLVAVDGRAPGCSAGLNFEEEAAVMGALGARDAVNLDGGGSTTMTVVTRPSDATGERPIGDAILIC